MRRIGWLVGAAALGLITAAVAQDRNAKVNNDREHVQTGGFWIYNDLPRGIAQAKASGKPLLVVFRCVPCEHCAQLDESLVERDASIQKLLEKFVCVRIVHANGMDLSLFQFDYDQSWAAFFLNADRTIYGRYGTRSHQKESADDMSLASFGKALEGALEVHQGYPKNRASLAGKQSQPSVKSPEEYPSLRGKFGSSIVFGPKVASTCIHCHQVREAQRLVFRTAGKAIPDTLLFPYPHPKVLGLIPDPATRSTLKRVTTGSSAEKDGVKAGDEILTVSGQPILSTADVQWVLQSAGETGSLKVQVRRAGKTVPLTLTLPAGWRHQDNISWRATSWDLRRMATGGMLLEELTPAERQQAGITDSSMALRAKHVGEYGAHAAAKRAGFMRGDVLIGVDGHSEKMSESELMAYLVNQKKVGEQVACTVMRGGQKLSLSIPMQ